MILLISIIYMKNLAKLAVIIAIGLIISFLPVPDGLSRDSWRFFSIFLSVVLGLIIEPFPSAFIGVLGIVTACILKIGPVPPLSGDVTSDQILKWGA